ncbi:right-handed parallel beta-helix repeat-containing protein [Spirochaetota bacterium]
MSKVFNKNAFVLLAAIIVFMAFPVFANASATLYVSESRGNNRNNGSLEKPLKDLQKAINDAPEGAQILVAEGNYQGTLDVGFIEIKKYVSIIGGYSQDFSKRDPLLYKTMIRPGPASSGTSGSKGLLEVYVRGKRNGVILIDGFILDKGDTNCYFLPAPDNPASGTPEGVETGRLDPPGFSSSGAPKMQDRRTHSTQLVHGDVEGQLAIRNCVLMNGSHFGIQMGNIGGHFDIYNNVFLANRMAACEIRSMNNTPGQATVAFHDNSVMFVWRRDPMPGSKDMGYGFRYMTGINADVYNNIFGCIDFAALDRAYVDSDKKKEEQRITSAWNNLFFSNLEADLTLPGAGMFQRVWAKSFEDVLQLVKYEGNQEMNQAQIAALVKAVDKSYLAGFLNMSGTGSMDHNPNSAENIFRSALGMPQRGTSSYRVSMYMNRYPLDKAYALFGAIANYGAQKPKLD